MKYRQIPDCRGSYAITVLHAKEVLNNSSVGKSIQLLLQQHLLSVPFCSVDTITLKANSSQSQVAVAVQTHQTSMYLQGLHTRACHNFLHFHQECSIYISNATVKFPPSSPLHPLAPFTRRPPAKTYAGFMISNLPTNPFHRAS